MKQCVGFALALLLVAGGAARASDPVGIYAVLDKVVLEPESGAPERVQLWGWFAFPKSETGFEFKAPERGYLYYTLPPGKEDVCRKEWGELKKSAGTGQCVAFSSRVEKSGHLRKADEKPANPEPYPVAYGVFKIRDSNQVARELHTRSQGKSAP